jgi:hypothetical protein
MFKGGVRASNLMKEIIEASEVGVCLKQGKIEFISHEELLATVKLLEEENILSKYGDTMRDNYTIQLSGRRGH